MHACQAWAVLGRGESVASDQDASTSLFIQDAVPASHTEPAEVRV